jgi:hypothetical protein
MPLNTIGFENTIKAILMDELAKKSNSNTAEDSINIIANRLSGAVETYFATATLVLTATCTTPQGAFPVVFTTKLIQ